VDYLKDNAGTHHSKSGIAQKAYELGFLYEGKYGACSQCTILAIMDALGQRNQELFKASFGFSGGIASLSKTCGALSAGVMMISYVHGRELENIASQTEEDKRECLQRVRDLHDRYVEEYGSIACADVHQKLFGRTFNQWDEVEFEAFLRLGGHKDKCTKVVGNVAKWTVELLSDSFSDAPP
jgi:C_GCAxxG_C_C family probable redox protein